MTNDSNADVFLTSSTSNFALGIILIACGFTCVPAFYYVLCMAIFNMQHVNSLPAFLLGLMTVLAGICAIVFPKKRVQIFHGADGGKIVIKDNFVCQDVIYTYGKKAKIRLSVVEENCGKGNRIDNWKVSLIDDNCQFVLDSHKKNIRPHDSKNLAVFLAKHMGCNLEIDIDGSRPISIPCNALGLPYRMMVKKCRRLLPQEPVRPVDCPIKIEDVSYGIGRRYTWGFTISSMMILLIVYIGVVSILSFLPIDRKSLFSSALKSGDWSFFIGAAFLLILMFSIWKSYRSIIEIYHNKISIREELWCLSYAKKTCDLDCLEMIFARNTGMHNYLVLLFDEKIVYLGTDSEDIGNYLSSDIRHFLISGDVDHGNEERRGEFGNSDDMSDY